MASLLRHELAIRRGAVIGWSIGISALLVYVIALFPDISPMFESMNLADIEVYQALGDFSGMGAFLGFLGTYVAYLPMLLAIYAIANGTSTLAGEEDNGTLEIILSLPLPRWKVLVSKLIALGLAMLLIVLLAAVAAVSTVSIMGDKLDTQGVTNSDIIVAMLGAWPLALLFATLSLFLGAILPNRRLAATTANLVLIVSFFGNNLAAVSEALRKIQFLFPLHYYNGKAALTGDMASGDLLVVLGATAGFLGLALLAFEHRNIMVGAWPWQRARLSG